MKLKWSTEGQACRWDEAGRWWCMDNEKQASVLAYSGELDNGVWKVVWFTLGEPNEYILMTEKGEEELRTYLKHKYLLLRGG